MALGKMVSMVSSSADRKLDRDAQMGRGEWRPVRELRVVETALTGGDWSVTDCGEGVSPNNWVNFRDFLTRSARSSGRRLFVVGGRLRSRWCRRPDKVVVSTAVTGAEMEVGRAWDDRTLVAAVLGKGDCPRARC